jgi:hypothetical protein
MRSLKNGIIAIIDGTISNESKKFLEIKITNSFPLIKLAKKSFLIKDVLGMELLKNYDHFSIPPDLRLHISGKKHIFFDNDFIKKLNNNASINPIKLFTFIGVPLAKTTLLFGNKKKEFDNTLLISLFLDSTCNFQKTRVFIDFFIHKEIDLLQQIIEYNFCLTGMRLSFDRNGCTAGPFLFEGFQRKINLEHKPFFTIRYGFVELDDVEETTYLHVPSTTC